MAIQISHLSVSDPDYFQPIGAAIEAAGLEPKSVRLYERFFGQKNVARIHPGSLLDHLEKAAKNALLGVDIQRVKYVIYTHTVAHCIPPHGAPVHELSARLGLAHAFTFALNQLNCTTGIYALRVAERLLLQAEPEDLVLVVSGERAEPRRNQVINNVIVMGEATSAFLVGRAVAPGAPNQGHQVLAHEFKVIGKYYAGIDLAGDLKRDYDAQYTGAMVDVITRSLERAGKTLDEVDLVIPHNVNQISWRQILDAVGISPKKLFADNIAQYGHCFTADPYVNLHSYLKQQNADRENTLALLCSSGIGASYGSAVVHVQH